MPTTKKTDYYRVLGIKRNADDKQIRQAFRELARKYHPDLNPDSNRAEANFKAVNEAYEVLSDPDSRKKYDLYGDNWKHADQFQQAGRGQGFDFANFTPENIPKYLKTRLKSSP